MNKLLIVSIAVFFFSCENSPNNTVFPTEPQAAFTDGNQEIMAARTPKDDAIFKIEINKSGEDVFGVYEWGLRINKASSYIYSPEGGPTTMNLDYLIGIGDEGCYRDSYPGYMQIHQDKKSPNIARIWFWFDAEGDGEKEVRYKFEMEGTFDGGEPTNWPPSLEDTYVEMTFTSWSFGTNGNIKKYGDIQCNLNDLNGTFNVKVTVERTS